MQQNDKKKNAKKRLEKKICEEKQQGGMKEGRKELSVLSLHMNIHQTKNDKVITSIRCNHRRLSTLGRIFIFSQ